MNFDANMISMLMQMLGSQTKQSEQRDSVQRENSQNYRDGTPIGQNDKPANPSVFAMQNGLGERIDFSPKPEKKQQANNMSNPMSSLLEMMGGKTSSDNNSMANLMPMLMNMMGARPQQNANTASKKEESEAKIKQNSAEQENAKNRQSNVVKSKINKTRDRYDPITFAGYTLISALNKLYISKKNEI